MAEQAQPLTLEISARNGRRIHVVCLDVVRDLGRTRKVYTALWDGRPVIAKVFTKWGKAAYHARREWRGLTHLEARQLNTPRPLLLGRTRAGWAVLTERIEPALTALECWDQCHSLDERVDLLARVAEQLARQHMACVIQTDLHLGNFLIKGDEVFILDPATMRFRRGEVGRARSIAQIAQLTLMLLEGADHPAVQTVLHRYADVRAWSVCPKDLKRLHYAQRRHRSQAIERGLRKFLRTNRRHQAIHEGPFRGVAERALLEAGDATELTSRLDEIARHGDVLKNGRTSFVSHTTLCGTEVVVKRYNHKGLLHSLRHTLKGSRARQGWLSANRLCLLGIPTPRPLAYVDEYHGLILWRSYLITEFARGRPLHGVLRDDATPTAEKQHLIDETLRLMDRLAGYGITHGDMKHTNILCNGTKVTLTDLDGMQVHRTGCLQRYRHRNDRARFLRDVGRG